MRLRRRKRDPRPVVAGAATAATALVAALVVALRRRSRRAADPREAWTCACGQAYLVQGSDRHRIHWLPGKPMSEPLLDRDCVACGAPLT